MPGEDFILPSVRDELQIRQRLELMMDNSLDTITFRNLPNELALPIRRIGAFLPGEGVGGSGIHWGGLALALPAERFPHPQRASPSATAQNAIPDDMTIAGLAGQL